MSDQHKEDIDFDKTVIKVPVWGKDKEGYISFSIKEGNDIIAMTLLDGTVFNVTRDHLIRLGGLAKPLTYREEIMGSHGWGHAKHYV